MKTKMMIILSLLLLLSSSTIWAEKKVGQNVEKENGRYQLFFGPHARADIFLVDTATGKIWSNIQYTNLVGKPTVWLYQDRIDSKEEKYKWLEKQEFIEKGKNK